VLVFALIWIEAPNETVEKTNIEKKSGTDINQTLDFSLGQRWSGVNRLKLGLDQRPEGVDLADIVNQSEQYPLYIHFTFGAQGEAIHVLMHADVGKDRLDNGQPSRIDLLALLAVDLGFHPIDQVRLTRVHLNRKIPARSA
jgi:hypothetical protein